MAVVIGDALLGYLAFSAVKAVGYIGAAVFINWKLRANVSFLKLV